MENNRRELPHEMPKPDSFPERAEGGRHARNGTRIPGASIARIASHRHSYAVGRVYFAQQVADGCSRTLELGAHPGGGAPPASQQPCGWSEDDWERRSVALRLERVSRG